MIESLARIWKFQWEFSCLNVKCENHWFLRTRMEEWNYRYMEWLKYYLQDNQVHL